MHKVSNNVAPLIFHDIFKKPSHKYPTNFSLNKFSLKKCCLNSARYSISFREPKLWNELLNTDEKQISFYNLISRKVKSKLLDTDAVGCSPLGVLLWRFFFFFLEFVCGGAPALECDFKKTARRLC